MFMWVSSVCFRAVSSGSRLMAVLRLAALDEKSLKARRGDRQSDLANRDRIGRSEDAHIWETSLTSLMPVERVISAASVLYRLSSESMSSAT